MSNNVKNNKINEFFEKLKKNKKTQYVVLGLLAIIALLIFMFGYKNQQSTTSTSTDYVANYVENLEERLSDVLGKVKGAGNVSVIITVESGMETVLAMKTITKEDVNGKIETETTPIIVNGKTVVLKELYPKIVGVLIVSDGAKNISVMSKLQQETVSLLNIDINQIEILST